MQIRKILAAVDSSPEGMQAAQTGARLASREAGGGQLIVLTVVAHSRNGGGAGKTPARLLSGHGELDAAAADQLARDVDARIQPLLGSARVTFQVGFGVPSVEIARLAEKVAADLIVLGRKRRTRVERWVIGDTSDATARRARVPCLFVHAEEPAFRRVLAAVDGGPATTEVLEAAFAAARLLGAQVFALHVEGPVGVVEGPAPRTVTMHHAAALSEAVRAVLNQQPEDPPQATAVEAATGAGCDVIVRQGEPVAEILSTIQEENIDLLVIGHHRGGPAGGESACTAPRLLHRAPCAVLTVPL